MQKLVWQNSNGDEIDLTKAPYGITTWEGFSNTSLNIQSQQVPFQDGGVFLDALLEQRELAVTLAMYDGNNLEERYRMRRELIHILNPKLGEGYLIYTNDFISKRIKCVAQVPLFETHNSNDSGTPKASLAWTACEPYWEDLEETLISCEQGIVNIINNEGEKNAQVEIRITGNAKNPKIKNITSDKFISYDGTVNGLLSLNTNFGKKNITQEEVNIVQKNNYSTYNDIQYINGYFYLITKDGSCYRTEDGVKFTLLFKENCILFKIKYFEGKGIFITGSKTTLMRSTDGIHFEKINIPTLTQDRYLEDISYNGTVFVIVLGQNQGITSNDLISWTSFVIENVPSAGDLVSIAYGNGIFLIANKYISTSSDGINWELKQTFNYRKIRVKFYNGFFVAVDTNGSFSYSTDGITWQGYILDGDGYLVDVIYDEDKNLYIACSANGNIFTTPNFTGGADKWTSITTEINSEITSISCNVNIFFIVGEGGRRYIGNSLDSLEKSIGMDFEFNLISCAYSSSLNKYLIIAQNLDSLNYVILESSDSDDWITKNMGGVYYKIIWLEDFRKFFICGYYGLTCSSDGETFEQVINTQVTDIVYNEQTGILTVIATNGNLYNSADGVNWTEYITNLPSGTYNSYICYNERLQEYYILRNNVVYKTTNFTNCDVVYNINGVTGGKIYYFKKLNIVSITTDEGVINSVDCINWDIVTLNMGQVMDLIYYDDVNEIIALCGNGCSISADCYNWELLSNYQAVYGIYIKDKGLFIIGYKNLVLYSELTSINKIANLNEESDINFNLNVGENQIVGICEEGIMHFEMIFTPKYIGV